MAALKYLQHLPAIFASVAALTLATPSHALLVTADAEVFIGGSSADSSSDSDGNSASASALADASNAFASATDEGALLVQANAGEFAIASAASFGAFGPPAPAGLQSAAAQATWSDTITNNTGTLVNYKWFFQVTDPRVGNSGHPDDYAALDIDILLNNIQIWEGYAELDNCILTTSNIDLIQSGCYAQGPSFTIALDLGNYVDGQTFTLDYIMTAFADTGDPYPISLDSTLAAIGDPFDQDPTAFGRIEATVVNPNPMPAPQILPLLAIGLAGIALARRKQHPSARVSQS